MRGTISTDPSDDASKVKAPNATSPEPRTRTWSSTSAASNSEGNHFCPAANLSSPAGRVARRASPQPTRPAPWWTQATASGWGSCPRRSPGSGMATERTNSRPVSWRLSTATLPSALPGHPPRTHILGALRHRRFYRGVREGRPLGLGPPVRQRARPPHVPADVQGQRRDEHRPDDDRVDQHADRDREPDLGELDQRQRAEYRERPGQHQARRGDHAAGGG